MRKTFAVGKLNRESARIVLVSRGGRSTPFRALEALVVRAAAARA